jgi:hypothetical protein
MRQYSSTAVLKTRALTGKHHNQRHTAVRVAIGKTLYFSQRAAQSHASLQVNQLTPLRMPAKRWKQETYMKHALEKSENKIATSNTVRRTNQDIK